MVCWNYGINRKQVTDNSQDLAKLYVHIFIMELFNFIRFEQNMIRQLDITAFLEKAKISQIPLIDVRSPAEFHKGHIPGAKNIPIFNDEERKTVGILYKQKGREEAILKGLDLVGPKMRKMVEMARLIGNYPELMVHCWRGGMRSESMAWLWHMNGYEVSVLEGGYKAYRKLVRQTFEKKRKFIVLGGKTGSGKTAILHALADAGEQVLDLEGLAHHKGSSFGGIGQEEQPTVQQFENDLYQALSSLNPNQAVWVEDESHAIGRVYVPLVMWNRMQQSPTVMIELPDHVRIERLVSEYAGESNAELKEAFQRISKRLGGKQLRDALDALELGNYKLAVKIALSYYDKAYSYGMKQKPENHVFPLYPGNDDPLKTANKLISLRKQTIYPNE